MDIQMLVKGQPASAEAGRTFDRLNPITGDLATRAPAASAKDAIAAADAAALAFPGWAALGPSERRGLLMNAASVLLERGEDLIQAMKDEIGATEGWARFNLMLAAGMIREAAALTTQGTGEVIPSDKAGCMAFSVRQPAGVVLGIAPWNAPIILGVRAIATPLACGNTVVLKASEVCPRTHLLVGQAFLDAGFAPGVVNVVTNAPADAGEVVGALIDHAAVKRINFTGSTRVGRIIAERAARNLKPALLELGGKAPLIVLEDADLEEAVKAAAFGAFLNQGQICMSTERIIVVDAVADAFVDRLTAKALTLKAGDPREGQAPLGAVVDHASAQHVRALIDDAVAKGAICSPQEPVNGVLVSATVLDRVTDRMRIYGEESFGPVVGVIRVKDVDEAVRVANDTDYGLAAAIFTKDIAKGLTIAKQIESGICHINGPTVHDEAQMPFGGVKNSGYGRFGGRAGIAEFTDLRWITVETQPGRFPF